MRLMLLILALTLAARAHADEGMLTFDNFPAATVRQAYGIEITPAWLEHVRLATIRLSNCTASFVSPDGLILTNHHCVESCLAELSSKDTSLIDMGYLAPARVAERRCSTQVADVLVGMENVTGAMDDGRFFFAKKCTVSLADEIDAAGQPFRRSAERDRTDVAGRVDHPFGEAEAVGKIFEVGGCQHHHGEGDVGIADLHRHLDSNRPRTLADEFPFQGHDGG